MALSATVETLHGERRELYIRLNNVEANNHDVSSNALFRGYLSAAAFKDGKHFVWEKAVEFVPDVSLPLWEQAYEALKPQITDVQDL